MRGDSNVAEGGRIEPAMGGSTAAATEERRMDPNGREEEEFFDDIERAPRRPTEEGELIEHIQRASTPTRTGHNISNSPFHSATGGESPAAAIPSSAPMIPTTAMAPTTVAANSMLPPPPPSIPITSHHPIPTTNRQRYVDASVLPARNIPFEISQVENRATILCPICKKGYKKFKFLKTHLQTKHNHRLGEIEARRGRNLLNTANDYILSSAAANQPETSANRKRKNQFDNENKVAKVRTNYTQPVAATNQPTPQPKKEHPIFKHGKRRRNDKIESASKRQRTEAPAIQTYKYEKRKRNDKIGSANKRERRTEESEGDTSVDSPPKRYIIKSQDKKLSQMNPIVRINKLKRELSQRKATNYKIKSEDAKLSQKRPVVELKKLNLDETLSQRKKPINYKIISEDEKLSRMRPVVQLETVISKKNLNTRKTIPQKYRIKSEDAKLSQLNPIVRLEKLNHNKNQSSSAFFKPYPKLMQPRIKLKKIDKDLLKPVTVSLKQLKEKQYVAAKDQKLLSLKPKIRLNKHEVLKELLRRTPKVMLKRNEVLDNHIKKMRNKGPNKKTKPYVAAKDRKLLSMTPKVKLGKHEVLEYLNMSPKVKLERNEVIEKHVRKMKKMRNKPY